MQKIKYLIKVFYFIFSLLFSSNKLEEILTELHIIVRTTGSTCDVCAR